MNTEIEQIFENFTIDNKKVPVYFLNYEGKEPIYIIYNSLGDSPALSGDNELLNSVISYDIHIFSKRNYATIETAVKALLKQAGWTWTGSSEDLYEPDTGYYHKVNNFEKERSY
jgi:hypothetical protein